MRETSRERPVAPAIWEKNVSAYAAVGVAGLVGGVLAGFARAKLGRLIDIDFVEALVRGGVVGSFAGLGVAALAAYLPDRRSRRTTRDLMIAVAVSALVFAFTLAFLADLATRGVL